MKKHELLKKAFADYPEGTVFLQMASKKEVLSSGKFSVSKGFGCFGITDDFNNNAVYDSSKNEWAEVVKQKTAVKVENEKEFNALMKYYDSLGLKWQNGELASNNSFGVNFDNVISFPKSQEGLFQECKKDEYQIISFSDFAKQKGIKLPLLTSEDGVDLYEGDEIFLCFISSKDNAPTMAPSTLSKILYTSKVFKRKQAALDWVEAQKPKLPEYIDIQTEQYIDRVYSTHLEIHGDFIGLINTGNIIRLDKKEIETILDTMNNKVSENKV